MAKPNYQFEKRQRDLAKKSKQEEKRRQKLAGKTSASADDGDQNAEGSSGDVAANAPDTPPSGGATS